MGKEPKEAKRSREWPVILKVARQYKLSPEQTILLLSVRDAENGPAGYEFGVKAAKGTDLETQAKWTAGSIKANEKRYNELMTSGQWKGSRRNIGFPSNIEARRVGGKDVTLDAGVTTDLSFIEFMGSYGSPTGYGWAPVHSPEMTASEKKLNKNWVPNVTDIYNKLGKQFQEKGAYDVKY